MYNNILKQELTPEMDAFCWKLNLSSQPPVFSRFEIEALAESFKAVKAEMESNTFTDAVKVLFERCESMIGSTSGYLAFRSEHADKNDILLIDSGGLFCDCNSEINMPVRGLRAEAYRKNKVIFQNYFVNSQWVKCIPGGIAVLKNIMFAPIVVGGKAVGDIGFANKPCAFNEHDAQIASCFGELAAIALANNKKIESTVRNAMELMENERKNVSRELHDGILSMLGAIKLKLEMILPAPGESSSSIEELMVYVKKTIEETRRLSANLSCSGIAEFNLISTIRWYCETIENCSNRLKIDYNLEIPEEEIPQVYKIIIYRVLQEAVKNASKHGEAEKIIFSLAKNEENIYFSIKDDGKGFNINRISKNYGAMRGHGLINMRDRVEITGGTFKIQSEIGTGTIIEVSLPGKQP